MSLRYVALVSIVAVGTGSLWAQEQGYIAKRDQGETLFNGTAMIKVSPRTGSQGGEMIWQSLTPGDSTGIHVHHAADEFFYVIRDSGLALVAGKETTIEAGDIIFVPKGSDHRLRGQAAGTSGPLEVDFLVDNPWLASEFSEWQAEYERTKRPPTLAELNRISEKYRTTYRTLQ